MDGKEHTRVSIPMDAPRANAITLATRLRLDLFAQYEAGRLLQEQREEVARLRQQLRDLKERMLGG